MQPPPSPSLVLLADKPHIPFKRNAQMRLIMFMSLDVSQWLTQNTLSFSLAHALHFAVLPETSFCHGNHTLSWQKKTTLD